MLCTLPRMTHIHFWHPNMAAQVYYSLLAIALLGAVSAVHAFSTVKFGYSGATGPSNWGKLSPSFSKCSNGKQQSPVHIIKKKTMYNMNFKSIMRDYPVKANATLINSGINLGILFNGYAGEMVLDGKNYSLIQFHWHSPAEHMIDGIRHPVELHMVHKAEDGSLAVVAILYHASDDDPLINKIDIKLKELTEKKYHSHEEAHISLNGFKMKDLRKKSCKYYRYVGSLTVPPCTENVNWVILGKVRSISKAQVELLKAPLDIAYHWNARPLQPLNGRKIEIYDSLRL